MDDNAPQVRNAGFWVRLAAVGIDWAAVAAIVCLAAALLNRLGVYVPVELAIVVLAWAVSVMLLSWCGRTLGKRLCGLHVVSKHGAPGPLRIFLRQTLAKPLSAAPLLVGFLWAGFSRRKRAWHDYLTGTCVVQNLSAARRGRRIVAVVLLAAVAALNAAFQYPVRVFCDALSLRPPADAPVAYTQRDPSACRELADLTPADRAQLADWLKHNAADPVEYAVRVAAAHDLTIFGEIHEIQDNLLLLQRMIPALYHRAGVRCIAFEVCSADDNAALARLVTGKTYDDALALAIARRCAWEVWGFKEYWDVFRTVWELNASLPPDAPRMRLVGMNARWDGPSLALTGIGGEGRRSGPLWERLRIVRAAPGIVTLLALEEVYARNVERETLAKGDRAIVWVGNAHAPTRFRPGWLIAGKWRELPRMGFILHYKYGRRVASVLLHSTVNNRKIAVAIEQTAADASLPQAAFDVIDSPFAPLRDGRDPFYKDRPAVCFADLTDGYIFLAPFKSMTHCPWMPNYISPLMLARNKPFYEMMAGRKLPNAALANEAFASGPLEGP